MKYKVLKGDLLHLEETVDAIVNSANCFMSKGGGHHGYPPDYALACAEQALEEYESKGLEAVLVLF